ncbi:MAG TPA: DUF2721 domain-containing protein [Polyangia bacterium]|jgi:hypothetical protein
MSLSLDALVRVMSASLAPVIVISGVGLLLLSMTNRYGRVIDRARLLAREVESAGPAGAARHLEEQLAVVWRRAKVLRVAIVLGALSILLVAITVLAIFAEGLAGTGRDRVAGWVFGLALVALVGSMVTFILDVTLSLRALKLEISRRD